MYLFWHIDVHFSEDIEISFAHFVNSSTILKYSVTLVRAGCAFFHVWSSYYNVKTRLVDLVGFGYSKNCLLDGGPQNMTQFAITVMSAKYK